MNILSQEIKNENGREVEVFEIKVKGGVVLAKVFIRNGKTMFSFEGAKCRSNQANMNREMKLMQELSPLITLK